MTSFGWTGETYHLPPFNTEWNPRAEGLRTPRKLKKRIRAGFARTWEPPREFVYLVKELG